MQILHLAPDEKFIPLAIDLFEEAFPGGNLFRLVGNPQGQYVEESQIATILPPNFLGDSTFLKELANCQILVVHSLNPFFVEAIEACRKECLIVWSGWGFEYGRFLEAQLGNPLLTASRRFLKRAQSDSLRTIFRRLANAIKIRVLPQRDLPSIAPSIDAFSVNPAEVPRLRVALPNLTAEDVFLPYYTTEDILSPGPDWMKGPDILVGNSATPTNNQVEVFEALRELNLEGRRVVVPLSYGDSTYAKYADYVECLGSEILGKHFVSIREFLPLEEFYNRIKTCGVVVMNQIRQQAIGSISAAFYKGARVVLKSFLEKIPRSTHSLRG